VLASTAQVGAMVFIMITVAALMGGVARYWWRHGGTPQH
jgi:hypothetical protein